MTTRLFNTLVYLVALAVGLEVSARWDAADLSVPARPPFALSADQRKTIHRVITDRDAVLALHPIWGWSARPNRTIYATTDQGIRSDRDYAPKPPPGKTRIVVVGDSFAYAADVKNRQTWHAQLEAMEPRVEVLNLAMLAHSLDQAYLRYREQGAGFGPQIVIVGGHASYIQDLDIVFRPFAEPGTRIPLSKPRYVVEGGRLSLLKNPLSSPDDYVRLLAAEQVELHRLGQNDARYQQRFRPLLGDLALAPRVLRAALLQRFSPHRPFDEHGLLRPEAPQLVIAKMIFSELRRVARDSRTLSLVVHFPDAADLERHRAGGLPGYAPLKKMLAREGQSQIDLLRALAGKPNDELFQRGHYSPEANRKVARFVLEDLRRRGLVR